LTLQLDKAKCFTSLGVTAFAAANTPKCPTALVNGESKVIKVFNFPSLKDHSAADVLARDR
jgi:hypothetical protein